MQHVISKTFVFVIVRCTVSLCAIMRVSYTNFKITSKTHPAIEELQLIYFLALTAASSN
jgi:hypothetical protein